MEVSRIRALRGPNLWSRHPSIEAIVTCTQEECALPTDSAFEKELRRIFP
jgi:cyanophycin synthetase